MPVTTRTVWVWFQTDKNGRRRAYYWGRANRAIPVSIEEADTMILSGQGIWVARHPLKGENDD